MLTVHRAPGFVAICLLVTLAGCGHGMVKTEEMDPRALFTEICETGSQVQSAKGAVWLEAKSKETSGRVSGVVDASSSDQMKMEITNPLGGTEAVISITGHHYSIRVPNRKERSEDGDHSWAGIPLRWANALFLGRFPCPEGEAMKTAASQMTPEGELAVRVPARSKDPEELYRYRFRPFEGRPWVESLHWEKVTGSKAKPVYVDFRFDDPESKTRSPRRWEAKGVQGEVKVKWSDRQTTLR